MIKQLLIRDFRAHMKLMGYTTRQIARECNVSSGYISSTLHGNTRNFKKETLDELYLKLSEILSRDQAALDAVAESFEQWLAQHDHDVALSVIRKYSRDQKI
jgi:transcriptional regulator with XRE-family HTH domain